MGWHNRTGLLLFAAAVALAPFVLPELYFRGIQIGMFALVAIGLSLLMGYAGQISLGHAVFYAIGAYTSGILTVRLGWSPWVTVWAGLALSGAVALAIGLPSLRLHGHYLAMATLAFGEIVNVVARGWIGLTGGPSGFGSIPRWRLFSLELKPFSHDRAIFYFVWAWVIVGLALALRLIHSRTGRALAGHFGGVRAVDGVDCRVETGQVFSVIGPNGAGKTTFFNCLNGVTRPTSGSVHFEGREITAWAPHRTAALGVAHTWQTIRLFHHMTVLENVLVGCHTRGRCGILATIMRLPSERREERRLRVLVLDRGRPLAEGSPREVQANEKVIAVYLGSEDEG